MIGYPSHEETKGWERIPQEDRATVELMFFQAQAANLIVKKLGDAQTAQIARFYTAAVNHWLNILKPILTRQRSKKQADQLVTVKAKLLVYIAHIEDSGVQFR